MRDDGSVMIETAMALPIVIFTIIATMFLGLYLNAQITVNSAARACAREYGVYGDYESAISRAESLLAASGLHGQYEIIIEEDEKNVEVEIYYNQPFAVSSLTVSALGDAGSVEMGNFNIRGRTVYRKDFIE